VSCTCGSGGHPRYCATHPDALACHLRSMHSAHLHPGDILWLDGNPMLMVSGGDEQIIRLRSQEGDIAYPLREWDAITWTDRLELSSEAELSIAATVEWMRRLEHIDCPASD